MSVDPGARGSAATAVAALGEAGHGVLPSPSSRAAALGAVLALAAAPFLGRAGIPAAMAALLLASVACQRRGDVAARNATLVAALTLATLFLPVGSWGWPAPVLLLAASALRSGWRGPDGLVPWLRAGSLRATCSQRAEARGPAVMPRAIVRIEVGGDVHGIAQPPPAS
jgi:hypothetical protein